MPLYKSPPEIINGRCFTAFRLLYPRRTYDVDEAMSVLHDLRENLSPGCFADGRSS